MKILPWERALRNSLQKDFCGCAWFVFSLPLEGGTMCPLAKQKLEGGVQWGIKWGLTAFPITYLEEARGSQIVTTSTLRGPLWALWASDQLHLSRTAVTPCLPLIIWCTVTRNCSGKRRKTLGSTLDWEGDLGANLSGSGAAAFKSHRQTIYWFIFCELDTI